ncbi:MAG: hypothetical protein K9N46_04265 [Candidatus Marinimicrobia bacterium]|nr:hypothetical protein [Candidatus Neomarinimicrobiota bacterium]MCF7828978.1 hypothetical protein [Candidatus Neomarinimicrobiota bacterium]MCF7879938.1 hypothetical protein [Candidatus Neomarinimicrobiota bacterium]
MFQLGISPRTSALGNASGVLVEDGTAFLANPANLAYVTETEFRGMYISQFGLADFNTLAITAPVSVNTVMSINWLRLSVDDIPLRPNLNNLTLLAQRDSARVLQENGLGTFQDREDAVFISLAQMYRWDLDLGFRYFKLPVETPIGVNVKYLNREIHTVKGSGIGLDVSAAIKFSLSELLDVDWMGKLGNGLMIQDVTGTPVSWNTRSQDVMRPAILWSASYEQPIAWEESQLNFVYTRSTRYELGTGYGIEFIYRDVLGLQLGHARNQLTGGLSFHTLLYDFPLSIEYAFGSHNLGNTHRLGLSLSLK